MRAYLYSLADVAPRTTSRPRGRPEIAPPLQQLLDDMHDVPAMILNRRMDILAWNRAATALLIDFGALPSRERNYIRLTFLNEDVRNLFVDWPAAARECVALLRREAGQHRDDRDLNDLVTELNARSAEFREWWAVHGHPDGTRHRVPCRASLPPAVVLPDGPHQALP
ncbi:hypothetical protein AB0B10_08680 [Micromonospora arborensis]|uniref:MmyB family transcriptional regulator n=1 Tax=Micromonospora arborensis TaxID=2116518 RepID=UPI0033EAA9CF